MIWCWLVLAHAPLFSLWGGINDQAFFETVAPQLLISLVYVIFISLWRWEFSCDFFPCSFLLLKMKASFRGDFKFWRCYFFVLFHLLSPFYHSTWFSGPPKGESNYEEAIEFDPIIHHNKFCPWVNGNVAAAGCSSRGSGSNADTAALCGWQLTLDALDALRSLGTMPIQTVQSESAASLYKDDHHTPGQKLHGRHSMSKSHGQHLD